MDDSNQGEASPSRYNIDEAVASTRSEITFTAESNINDGSSEKKPKVYFCKICKSSFNTLYAYNNHRIKTKLNDYYQITSNLECRPYENLVICQCGMSFTSKTELHIHVQSHPFVQDSFNIVELPEDKPPDPITFAPHLRCRKCSKTQIRNLNHRFTYNCSSCIENDESKLNIKIVTYNCKNLNTSIDALKELLKDVDILALQETYLMGPLPLDLISDDFGCFTVPAKQGSRGRMYGGLAIWWRKSKFDNVIEFHNEILDYNDDRIAAVKARVRDNPKEIAIINIYMITETTKSDVQIFEDLLGDIIKVHEKIGTEYAFILGDFNAHPGKYFYERLKQFCTEKNYICLDTMVLGLSSGTYTYLSAKNTKSWLDHCLATHEMVNLMRETKVNVLYDVHGSDHYPLQIEFDMDLSISKVEAEDVTSITDEMGNLSVS